MELAANPRSIWGGFRSIPRLQQRTEVSSPALLESPARLGRAFGGDTTSWCRSEAAFTCPAQGCPGICKALHWWQVGPSDRIAATSLPGARTPRGDTCQEPSAAARGLQQCQGDPGEGATPESCRENSFWPQKGQQEESSWPWGRHTSITRLLRCSLTVPAKPLMFLQRLPQPLLAWICLSCVLGATWTPRSHPAHTPSTPRLQPHSVLVRAPGMRRPHAATLKGTAPGTRLLSDQSGGNRA